MENLLLLLPFLVPVVLANLGERRSWARNATYALLIAINVGLLGVVGLALLSEAAMTFMPELVSPQGMDVNWMGVAVACLATSLLAFLPLFRGVRVWLSRWMRIEPGSTVHVTAIVFAIYQIGLSFGQMAIIGDLENLVDANLRLTIWDLLLNGALLTLLALLGVGVFVRRDWSDTLVRLGVRRPTWKQLLAAVGVTFLLLAVDFGVNQLWQRVDPAAYDLLERVTESLFGNLMTVGGALALGLSAGISEELLFRGAVQPRLGLLLATLLFTLGHLQYGLTIAAVEVFVIGLVLGFLRNRTNTTNCMFIHAGYNAASVLLGLLQP